MPTRPPIHRSPNVVAAKRSYVTKGVYGSQRWKDFRRAVLVKRGWRCEICGGPIKRGVNGGKGDKVDVDHIVRARDGDDPLFWDEKNVRVAHHACHSRKTCEIDGGFGNPKRKVNA